MGRGKRGKKPNSRRNQPPSARDIQTPVTDRENTTEQEGNLSHEESAGEEFASNAGDPQGSDPETGSEEENEGPPAEDKPIPLKRWVKEVIRDEASGDQAGSIEKFFNSEDLDASACRPFFERLNQQIRAANHKHQVADLDEGTIPPRAYDPIADTCRREILAQRGNPEAAWDAFHRTRDLLKLLNRRHHLPRSWNFHPSWCERLCGPDPTIRDPSDEESEASEDETQNVDDLRREQQSTDDYSGSDDPEISMENRPTGLDSLESRAMKEQRRQNGGKVLYWWPKGTGSQIFVRYGDRSAPIYRIRAGSHEIYDQKRVEKVLTTKTRGSQKVEIMKDGILCEEWRFSRQHVEDIRGIGWKVEDDDEVGIDPLSFIQPVPHSVFPQTRALVKWKDGNFTLEGRQFVRRITNGSSHQGDQVIYQKAKDLEIAYRLRHGWDESDSEIDLDDDRSPQRYTKMKRRSEIETDTETDNDISSLRYTNQAQKRVPASARHRGRARARFEDDVDPQSDESGSDRMKRNGVRSKRSTHPRQGNSKDKTIRILEEKLQRLEMNQRRGRYRR
ncbi:hypothetical protein N7532_001400 [Penicillium argentinense]|uniref:Uncharacterized protein n=1 Tax=Penicillium argentinense TaxID=1131581 RepID=A0A9W9KLR1_9EURO|nr:uncharacterized protein N7532_001400 [Penicillium argentinense]KAJ5110865.1 hypothetical protein N7532_001400 [Penicillium argentinense]